MKDFCGEDFWDLNRTWPNSTNDDYSPDFTVCFEQTALAWIPCGFLWLLAGVDVFNSLYSRGRNIPWTALNVVKCVVIMGLGILQLLLVFRAIYLRGSGYLIYPVEIYTPVIRVLTMCLALFLLLFSKAKGVRSSGVQFLFWLLLTVCEAFSFRTVLISYSQETESGLFLYIVHIIYYPFVICQFLLNCWADAAPQYRENLQTNVKACPEEEASFLSSLTFFWFEALAWKGYKKPLEYTDLWELNSEDKSRVLVPIFDRYWHRSLQKAKLAPEKRTSASFQNGSINFEAVPNKHGTANSSVFPTLVRAFGATFVFGSFLKLTQDLLAFVSPQILKLLISYVAGSEASWKGYIYAVLLLATSTIQTLVLGQYFHRMFLVGMRVRTTLVSAIYRKALLLSNTTRRETTIGEIVNLMSTDAQRFMDLTTYLNMLWSAPLQISLSIYFLWQELGPSVLAGLAVMLLLIPVNAALASIIKTLQIKQMKKKDQRVKLMSEILSGIKVLKLYAWEPSFEEQVMKIRKDEIRVLRSAAYLNAVASFVWTSAPFMVALASFATFVLSDEKNVLDAQKAFVSLALFNLLRFPLHVLPSLISSMIQASVSLTRVNKYMNAAEIDPKNVTHELSDADPIVLENASFSWESDKVVLRNINFSVKEGSLVAIVGPVGSGKSTLLSAILGEVEKTTGRVNTKGTIAYVAQQSWIQNATLRENIQFGRLFEPAKYDRVIDCCALKPDIDILPAGDKTEIGEKGINLSGGQKARVSLARATYNNADLYLLDDPLSAVDAHVGKHIFEKVIGPKGLLKRKTRVLVTHGITFLPEVDFVIVIKDGVISESGTYKDLLAKKGAFAEFLVQHISSEEEKIDANTGVILQDLETVIGQSAETIIARQRSRISESESLTERAGSIRRQTSTISQDSGERSSPTRKMSRVHDAESAVKRDVAKDKLMEIEKTETGSVRMNVYRHYIRAVGIWMTFLTLLFNLLYQGFTVMSNFWLSAWSNEPAINGTQDTSKRDLYLGVYGALGAAQALTALVGNLILFSATMRAASLLHESMLRNILRNSLQFFDTTPAGRLLNRFGKDLDTVDNLLPTNLRMGIQCLFVVLSTIAVISYSTPIFMSVIIPVGILYLLIQRFYVATSRQLKRLESVSRSPIYSHFSETLSGAQTIRAFAAQDRFILESENKVDHNQIAYFPAIVSNRWLAVRLETIGNFIIFFAAIFAVEGRKTMTAGLVGLSISYALQVTQTLNWLVRMSSDVETNIVAVERIKEYAETPQEAEWEIKERKPPSTWPETGAVTFDKYQTRYREGLELVLKDITCQIQPAEKIGIVGRTGAGKSSLTLALFRIIEPAGGSIVIDGQNISKLGLHDLRGRITIIPQDPVLFSGTLRINLDPFHTFPDEVVWRALELSHLKPFVSGLNAGLEYEISEGGDNLSVGQRQLVCLARALLRKTKILILDEATAAIDLETDDLIQQTIKTEFADSTIITIAHRLNTIMDSTRVMVLDKGEICEFDTPDTLLKNKDSIFYGMAKNSGLVERA